MSLGSLMEPISCGGVVVHPGDLVMGDINGVVVVPAAEIEDVLAEAKKIIQADAFWQKAIEQGRDPAEIERQVPLP
jgi:regulator of RNase E activity RraA